MGAIGLSAILCHFISARASMARLILLCAAILLGVTALVPPPSGPPYEAGYFGLRLREDRQLENAGFHLWYPMPKGTADTTEVTFEWMSHPDFGPPDFQGWPKPMTLTSEARLSDSPPVLTCDDGAPLPVVVYVHGGGHNVHAARAWENDKMNSYLAERGFVVAAFDVRDLPTLCRGGISKLIYDNLLHVVDNADNQITNGHCIDRTGYHVIGHSVGGHSALTAAGATQTLKSALPSVDAFIQGKVTDGSFPDWVELCDTPSDIDCIAAMEIWPYKDDRVQSAVAIFPWTPSVEAANDEGREHYVTNWGAHMDYGAVDVPVLMIANGKDLVTSPANHLFI